MKLFSSEQSTTDQMAKAELAHVLIMQLDDSGAVVMLGPALRALREALPHAQLTTLLTTETGSQMAPLLPWVDHVMVDQAVWQERTGIRLINPREEIAFIERLRRQDFSLALIFSSVSQSPLRAAFACYLAGIPYRVGFAKGAADPFFPTLWCPRRMSFTRWIGISNCSGQSVSRRQIGGWSLTSRKMWKTERMNCWALQA